MSEHAAIKWQLHAPVQGYYTVLHPQLAHEIGLNESLMLVRIAHWISTSNNLQDGMYWTYQSLRDIQEKAFPFWSLMTISRIIKSLVNDKYIVVGNFNKRKGDQTQWFALVPDTISRLKSVVLLPIKGETIYQSDTPPYQNDTPTQQNDTTLPKVTTKKNSKKTNAPSGAKGSMFGFRTSPANAAYWTEHTAALNYLRAAIGIDANMCPLPTSASELTNVIGAHQDLHRAGLVSALAIANYVAWLQAKYANAPNGLHWSQIRGQISVYLSQQENQLPNGKPKVTAKDILGTTVIIK